MGIHEVKTKSDDEDEPEHDFDLATEVGHGAVFDVRCHSLHSGWARITSKDFPNHEKTISKCDKCRPQNTPKDRPFRPGKRWQNDIGFTHTINSQISPSY